MSKRMLIDARHPEETRVVVVEGNRLEEFDYESANKVELKGNIYLAKITRVEPSLQAAFVEYGGNRHGFLAFSEIHPDYYQIPVADREKLLAEEAKNLAPADNNDGGDNGDIGSDDNGDEGNSEADEQAMIDESLRQRRIKNLKRRYKIQEVIKRGQIVLIQVVKEERGSKGAALTTYLSLAGRYSVLMPNTTSGGGVSRRIADVKDRKRLKKILSDLNIPSSMGCIIRTAGAARTKTEVKRDLDYLLKLWDGIRTLTLKSTAPTLIYEEGNLIKRAIRDLYDRSIDDIQIEGEEGYRTAKEFMKLLMPSHAKKVQHYKDKMPLFHRYQVESQLEEMFSPRVELKSGGYIIINPTEALIAIDVNSGRATKGHNIEETALKTNMEAAKEVARQLRLRDMAGIIVVDFIDMEARNNNRKVERAMKDALKPDRARIQTGRISSLGLMELSRQRLHPNLIETATSQCPHCQGMGRVRNTDSAALHAIRVLEEEGIRDRSAHVTLRVNRSVAVYLLNNKRKTLSELEKRYNFTIEIRPDDNLISPNTELDRVPLSEAEAQKREQASVADLAVIEAAAEQVEEEKQEKEEEKEENTASSGKQEAQDDKPKKRRRRGRRGGRKRREARERREARDTGEGKDSGKKSGEKSTAKAEDKGNDEGEKAPGKKPARRKPAQKAGTEKEDKPAKSAEKSDGRDRGENKKPASRKEGDAGKKNAGKAKSPDSAKDGTKKAEQKKPASQKASGGDQGVKPEPEGAPGTRKSPQRKTGPARKGWWQRAFSPRD